MCHEVFRADDENHVMTLVDFKAICWPCNLATHIGFARVKGLELEALEQLIYVNRWTANGAIQARDEALAEHARRSRCEWTFDFSALTDLIYSLDPFLVAS
jgi:hypothetical protein